jgi:hypothetical protein
MIRAASQLQNVCEKEISRTRDRRRIFLGLLKVKLAPKEVKSMVKAKFELLE